MDCDNCIYQGSLENSRHSTCNHPEVRSVINDSSMLGILIRRIASKEESFTLFNGFKIEINEQGIEGDWALWPFNFDPIWIKTCTGYKEV